MSLLLNLETATSVCSVALAENGSVLAFREIPEGRRHADLITIFIQECMQEAGRTLQELNAIAVSKGPGSYTGLRIGVSTAKGLCYTLGIPLIGINTLEIMAAGKKDVLSDHLLLCPMIDARRMEVYCALFNAEGHWLKETSADILNADAFAETLKEKKVHFFGDGAAKCQALIAHQANASFDPQFITSARFMADISNKEFNKENFKGEDVAYFEPFYLKDFYSPSHHAGN